MMKLFNKRTTSPTVLKEAAGFVRLMILMPDGVIQERQFKYQDSIALLHPDDKSSWFLIMLDEGKKDAFTFAVHQDRLLSLEIVEGHYIPKEAINGKPTIHS